MQNSIKFLIITIALIILFLLGFIALNLSKPTQTPPKTQNLPSLQPKITKIQTIEGTVTKVNHSTLSLKTNQGEKTFSLERVIDVSKISTPSAQPQKLSLNELRVGQKLVVVLAEGSSSAQLILVKP